MGPHLPASVFSGIRKQNHLIEEGRQGLEVDLEKNNRIWNRCCGEKGRKVISYRYKECYMMLRVWVSLDTCKLCITVSQTGNFH